MYWSVKLDGGNGLGRTSSGAVKPSSRDTVSEESLGFFIQLSGGSHLSPVPVFLILIGRSLATLITATINILLFAVVILWTLKVNISLQWQGLVIFIITMAGLFGFGFIIAGMTLIFKRVGELAGLTANALLFLNGSMLPVEQFPRWLALVAKTLPTTQGIILLRDTLLKMQPLYELWKDGSLLLLCSQSIIYFGGGLLVFIWCARKAKL